MAKKLSKSWFKTRAEGRSAKRQSAECKMPTNQLEPRLKVDRVGNKKGHAGSACVGVCGCVCAELFMPARQQQQQSQ